MQSAIVNECAAKSLAGKISFPEVVAKLSAAGIERYTADLIGLKKFFFSAADEIHTCSLEAALPKVGAAFNEAEIKAALSAIQQNQIVYQEFLRRIMQAGCSHYEVFITGKRAIYFGRDGSQYIEWFPKR